MSQLPDAKPVLDYEPKRPVKKKSLGMLGPNLLILFGIICCWRVLHVSEAHGLFYALIGGFAILAGFKSHVIDVVKAYS